MMNAVQDTITLTEAQEHFAEVLQRALAGERLILTQNGKALAAIIAVEDLEKLETFEDYMDGMEALNAKAETERVGTTTLEDFKKELGLD